MFDAVGPEPASTVAELAAALGPPVVRQLLGPASGPVLQVVVYDAVHPPELRRGDLVLAVGVSGPAVAALLAQALASSAAGVVVKEAPGPELGPARLPVLVVDPVLEWGQVHRLLLSALPASGPTSRVDGQRTLFDLANALAELCGGPVVIHDPGWRLLAYSANESGMDDIRRETILGRRLPVELMETLRAEGVLARLWAGESVQVGGADHPGLAPRLAAPAMAGREILGTIWVLLDTERPGPAALAALRDGARVAAMHLLRHRVEHDIGRHRGDEVVGRILDGEQVPAVQAERAGIPVDGTFAVVGLEPGGAEPTEPGLTRLAAHARVYLDAYRIPAHVAVLSPTLYLLMPLRGTEPVAGAVSTLFRALAQSAEHPVLGGIARPAAGLAGVPPARDEVDHVLALQRGGDRAPGLYSIDEVRSAVQLRRLSALIAADPDLSAGPVGRLAGYDARRGTELVPTLDRYFRVGMDIRLAAEALNIHQNTLRYRLRRIAVVSGLRLEDPDDRLMAELQLRCH